MEFNTLVKTKLFPILEKYGFGITEEFKNIIRFQSSFIEINIVYNDYEKSCYISIGKKGKSLYELRNNAIRELLNSSLLVEQVVPAVFVQNLSTLFETKEGTALLKGNIDDFVKFKISEDNHYTLELVQHQTLEAALKAWERKDYKGFVESMNEIDFENIPLSYQLKYKIAKQKL
ncbi:MAG: hypothetical protein RL308_686 [Bacteroidota bacterium]|jgi:hypothetical protein